MNENILRFKDILLDYLEDKNITKKSFASNIDITEKQFSRILNGDKLSSDVIRKIALVTNIKESFILRIENDYYTELEAIEDLKERKTTKEDFVKKFNISKYENDFNIEIFNKDNIDYLFLDTLRFYEVANIKALEKKFEITDNSIYYKSKNENKSKLYIWLEYCTKEIRNQEIKTYNKKNIDNLVQFITKQAFDNKFNKELLINKFNEQGVGLVIKDAPSGTKVRGAFRVLNNKPAIFLTLLHKRPADIYFALLHEIAHLKTDFNKAKAGFLIHEDECEENADKVALNYMIPDDYFEKEKDNLLDNIENNNKYPKMFIIYRLALQDKKVYKSNEYQKYNKTLKNY